MEHNLAAGMISRFSPEELINITATLFTRAAEGLVVVDRSGIICLQNPRLAALFGYANDELLGQHIEVLLPEALRQHHVAKREAYQHAPVERSMGSGLDLQGRKKDGTLFPVEVSLNHMTIEGNTYVMGLVSDVSRRRAAEKELQRINNELEQRVDQRTAELREAERNVRQALEKEKELNALKSRFVSMASHEFRTPLSTIMSSVDLIARYTADSGQEKTRKHVDRIRGKVRDLTAMLNDFLSLDKLEQGMVECHPVDVDIVHLSIELIEELRALAKPGQEINYDHEGEQRMVFHDRQMLSTVLSNLLSNAIKYSPEGKHVHLITGTRDGRLHITVKDQGIGIPPEDHQHIMQRFFRASNAFVVQGTGLGLNITARFIDLMGGSIRFESKPGEGTTFHAEIDLHHAKKDHTSY